MKAWREQPIGMATEPFLRLLISDMNYEIGRLVETLRVCEKHCTDGFIAERARELLAEHGVHVTDGLGGRDDG